jgi:hypothetical protein
MLLSGSGLILALERIFRDCVICGAADAGLWKNFDRTRKTNIQLGVRNAEFVCPRCVSSVRDKDVVAQWVRTGEL